MLKEITKDGWGTLYQGTETDRYFYECGDWDGLQVVELMPDSENKTPNELWDLWHDGFVDLIFNLDDGRTIAFNFKED